MRITKLVDITEGASAQFLICMDFQFLAIWAAQGSNEKKWAEYEQLLRFLFHVLMGKNIVASAIKRTLLGQN